MTHADPEVRWSDGLLFEVSELDRAVSDVVPRLAAPTKWAAINAIRHLNRAWKLKDVDNSMALFRAITAEEEAAAALFRSLKRHRYEGAKALRTGSHLHKHAVIPFLQAVSHALSEYPEQPDSQLYINPKDERPRLVFRFRTLDPVTGADMWAYPQPPLNFSASRSSAGGPLHAEDFARGIEAVISQSNAKDMIAYVRERADQRNRILYATEQGYFEITFEFERMFEFFRDHTFTILRVLLMIDPYRRKQLFVQQALTAFLHHLQAIPEGVESVEYPLSSPHRDGATSVSEAREPSRRRSRSNDM